jgi:hypothetical protein
VPVHGSYVTVYEGDSMIRDIRFTGKFWKRWRGRVSRKEDKQELIDTDIGKSGVKPINREIINSGEKKIKKSKEKLNEISKTCFI